VIQLGKRSILCSLVAVAALTISGNALAQNPPTPTPTPTDPAANDPNNPNPVNNPAAAQPTIPPAEAPPATPAQPKPVPEAPKVTFPTMAGPMLRLSEIFAIRPGVFFQFWGSLAQDQIPKPSGDSGKFAKNFYLRRARFYLLGTIGKNITWFTLWESANLGLAGGLNTDMTVNKNYTQLAGAGTAFGFNDAWMDFKVNSALSIQAGLFLIPFTRNILQSTATYWTLDIAGVSATYIGVTQTNVLRDEGVQVKLNAADGRLEARAMVSQGVKLAEPLGGGRLNGKNDPRFTGYLQYNFFDPDAGYVFNGQYFGRKKIAGLALGGDYQSINGNNPYFATSATLFAAIPLKGADPKNGGDEFGGQVEYVHFHGGGLAPSSQVSALGKRDGLLVEAGYYNKNAKLSVFGKFEGLFLDGPTDVLDSRIYAGGFKYFIAEAACNLTLQYSFTAFPNQQKLEDAMAPRTRHDASTIQAQLQLGYF
jgi:hypothetical protein